MKLKALVILTLFLSLRNLQSQNLIPQYNKTVTFVYVEENGKLIPNGTAFFVSVPSAIGGVGSLYLVTNKHVAQDKDGNFFDKIYIRYNLKNGKSEIALYELKDGLDKRFFIHSDETVDLLVLQLLILPIELDFKHIITDQALTRSEYSQYFVDVGSDVFFTGLFLPFVGEDMINPVFRFGKICLLPSEKILQDNVLQDLILIESSTLGGNSGSPVLCTFQKGNTKYSRLIGVVKGGYNNYLVDNKDPNNKVNIGSLGISAIVPIEYLLEILNYPHVTARRK